MKKITFVLLVSLALMTLSACQSKNANSIYIPNLPNYEFEPSGETVITVSEVESGSALLSFNELENVSHYKIEVAKSDEFNQNDTLIIVTADKQYRLYFDDHSVLYTRASAIAYNGKSYATSLVKKIEGKYATYHGGDDFNLGTVSNWTSLNADLTSDYHSLIVKPINNESIEISKTFNVNLDVAQYLQIRFLTKNSDSKLSVTLEANDELYIVKSDISQIERGYIRFDLDQLNLKGTQNLTLHFKSEGTNRGFQLDYIKFISEHPAKPITQMIHADFTNQFNEVSTINNQLVIENDPEPTIVLLPSIEVEFDPLELPMLEIVLSGYYPRDTFKLSIHNSDNELVYESEQQYIQNLGGKFTYHFASMGIMDRDMYKIGYTLSSDHIIIDKMQLVGESDLSYDVTYGQWVNGVSAYIDMNHTIRLKETTIYNYGDIRKELTVDLGATPIVFFDVVSIVGAWAVKVIPEGATSDLYVIRDNSNTGKFAVDLSQILQSQGITTFTFEIFVIGGYKADQTAALVMNPIHFGNALNIVSNTSDEVISHLNYDVGDINLDDLGYIYIDIADVSLNTSWKLYIINLENGRRYEMKTALETKYPQRYNRNKVGRYIYDIKAITKLTGNQNLGISIEVIGNGGRLIINDVVFSTNNNIPAKNNSAY